MVPGRAIPGFPDYTIDQNGNVFSTKQLPERWTDPTADHVAFRELKQFIGLDYARWGYRYVTLMDSVHKKRTIRIAKLLTLAWGNSRFGYDERDYRLANKRQIIDWCQLAAHMRNTHGGIVGDEVMAKRPLPKALLDLKAMEHTPEAPPED